MKNYLVIVILSFLFSCAQQESKKANTPSYFDITGYFAGEANRLQKTNPTIVKEVIAVGKAEQRSTTIKDWKTELVSFSNSDINKAAWAGEFTVTQNGTVTSYSTENPKIPVKKVEVTNFGDKITGIKIFKATENYLYNSTDTLLYYPDSLYLIQNHQKVKLLNAKDYKVIGKLK